MEIIIIVLLLLLLMLLCNSTTTRRCQGVVAVVVVGETTAAYLLHLVGMGGVVVILSVSVFCHCRLPVGTGINSLLHIEREATVLGSFFHLLLYPLDTIFDSLMYWR